MTTNGSGLGRRLAELEATGQRPAGARPAYDLTGLATRMTSAQRLRMDELLERVEVAGMGALSADERAEGATLLRLALGAVPDWWRR